MQVAYGSGKFFVTPISDAFGNLIASPTPFFMGILQDCAVDLSFDTKELYGQGQFPVDIGRGKAKIGVKAKSANISMKQFNDVMFGQSVTTGATAVSNDTAGTAIPASTPFTITPTVPNAGTWAADLGVRYKLGGILLTKVSTAPATGQYSVTNGVYTFAAADTGLVVLIDFRYTTTTGKSLAIANLAMGEIPVFQAEIQLQKGGKQTYMRLPYCVSSKLGFNTKQDDYMIPDFDMMGFADPNGNAYYISGTE